MILKKNNLQTVQEWNKSDIKLIALYVHPNDTNHLDESRATMALDHSRLANLQYIVILKGCIPFLKGGQK